MLKLIPDTNFLIYLAEYKLLDKLFEYKIFLLKPILIELIIISKSTKERRIDRENAHISLMFLEKIKEKIKFIENIEGSADAATLELAKREKACVGTMDKELIKKLRKKNIKIVYIRQKRFLEEK